MKTKNLLLKNILFPLTLSFLLISCSTPKKTAVACPVITLNKINEVSANHTRQRNNSFTAYNRLNKKKQTAILSGNNHKKAIIKYNVLPVQKNVAVQRVEGIPYSMKIEYSKGLLTSVSNANVALVNYNAPPIFINSADVFEQPNELVTNQPANCDTIVMKSGALLTGKVEEIGQKEVKYRKCNNLSGPVISILKSDVAVIIYTNGTHDFFSSSEPFDSVQDNPPVSYINAPIRTEGLGIAGFVSSIIGLIIAGIPLGLVAVIFGSISLSKIRRDPGRLRGRGFAIAALILGIIDIVGVIILLASAAV